MASKSTRSAAVGLAAVFVFGSALVAWADDCGQPMPPKPGTNPGCTKYPATLDSEGHAVPHCDIEAAPPIAGYCAAGSVVPCRISATPVMVNTASYDCVLKAGLPPKSDCTPTSTPAPTVKAENYSGPQCTPTPTATPVPTPTPTATSTPTPPPGG